MMEHLLISACLLGAQCRYDGQSKPVLEMVALSEQFDLVPLCPEQLGGLPTPRTPAERIEDRVMTKDGRDVTAEYRHGAEQALHLARLCGCKIALLKLRRNMLDGNFMEGMACQGGCVNGNGNLTHMAKSRMDVEKYGKEAADKTIEGAISEFHLQ